MTGMSVAIASSPSFMIEPLPYCFSIWLRASSSALLLISCTTVSTPPTPLFVFPSTQRIGGDIFAQNPGDVAMATQRHFRGYPPKPSPVGRNGKSKTVGLEHDGLRPLRRHFFVWFSGLFGPVNFFADGVVAGVKDEGGDELSQRNIIVPACHLS